MQTAQKVCCTKGLSHRQIEPLCYIQSDGFTAGVCFAMRQLCFVQSGASAWVESCFAVSSIMLYPILMYLTKKNGHKDGFWLEPIPNVRFSMSGLHCAWLRYIQLWLYHHFVKFDIYGIYSVQENFSVKAFGVLGSTDGPALWLLRITYVKHKSLHSSVMLKCPCMCMQHCDLIYQKSV